MKQLISFCVANNVIYIYNMFDWFSSLPFYIDDIARAELWLHSIGKPLDRVHYVSTSRTAHHCFRVATPPQTDLLTGGGWGCEVSCGGYHRPRGKTTTGSALDGAVFDIAQILAYLVHNMSRSQIILGVWPFWLAPFFYRSITFWRAYG